MKTLLNLLIIGLLIVLMNGCTNESNESGPGDSGYKEIVEELSSAKMEGRLTGTQGNDLAVEMIANEFKEIGLEYYENDSFKSPYSQTVLDNENMLLQVILNDGKTKSFEYGEDYLEQQVSFDFEGQGLIETAIDQLTPDSVFVTEQMGDLPKGVQSEGKFILLKSDNFKRYLQQ
ncbi:hypothetical protein [Cohnella lupini]|uniref:Uncharacterized protein n=1 Tax=Cohnella lupini TaxID=1294267 RepID=A0A3D9I0H0_9BACL|nr:hypothetical protein [Cohnella lupini]RED55268.1 hypothetical protein DFP95_1183 [Cohnella lupini]